MAIDYPPEFVAAMGSAIKNVRGLMLTPGAATVLAGDAQRMHLLQLRYPAQYDGRLATPRHYGVLLVGDGGTPPLLAHARLVSAGTLQAFPSWAAQLPPGAPVPTQDDGSDAISVVMVEEAVTAAGRSLVQHAKVDFASTCVVSAGALAKWADAPDVLGSIASCLHFSNRFAAEHSDTAVRHLEPAQAAADWIGGPVAPVPVPGTRAKAARYLRIKGHAATEWAVNWLELTEVQRRLEAMELGKETAPAGASSKLRQVMNVAGAMGSAGMAYMAVAKVPSTDALSGMSRALDAAIADAPVPLPGDQSWWGYLCGCVEGAADYFDPRSCPDPTSDGTTPADLKERLLEAARGAHKEQVMSQATMNVAFGALTAAAQLYAVSSLHSALNKEAAGLIEDINKVNEVAQYADHVSVAVEKALVAANAAVTAGKAAMTGQPLQQFLAFTAISTAEREVGDAQMAVVKLIAKLDALEMRLGERKTTVQDIRNQLWASAATCGVQSASMFVQLRHLQQVGAGAAPVAYGTGALAVANLLMAAWSIQGALAAQQMLGKITEQLMLVTECTVGAKEDEKRLAEARQSLAAVKAALEASVTASLSAQPAA